MTIIRPFTIKTNFWSNAKLTDNKLRKSFLNFGKTGYEPDCVAEVILKACKAKKMKSHYDVPFAAKLVLFKKWILPSFIIRRAKKKFYKNLVDA